MSLDYDLRKLDIPNLIEFWESTEYDEKGLYTNWEYFTVFVHRLMVLRSVDCDLTVDNVKETIIRNRMYESICEPGFVLPIMFIRRMIGLSTNVFPSHNREQFGATLERIVRENTMRYMPTDWDNF